jgi:hypothetical protein
LTLETEFVPYLDQIIPQLLAIAEESIEWTSDNSVKTYDEEEAKIAVLTLSSFLETLGSDVCKFINEIYRLLSIIIENSVVDDTRNSALKCVSKLVKIAKNSGIGLPSAAKHAICRLWSIMDSKNDTSSLCEFVSTMQKIVKYSGAIFNEIELIQFYEKCVDHLKKFDESKTAVYKADDEDKESEADLGDTVKDEQEVVDDFKIKVAKVFGLIFRSHKASSLGLFQPIYSNLIVPGLANENSIKQQFTVFLIMNSAEHICELLSKEILVCLLQASFCFTLSPHDYLRKCSLTGIGFIAHALGQNFLPYFEETVKYLTQSMGTPKKKNQSANEFATVREMGVASLGNIVQLVGDSISPEKHQQYLGFWVNNLPIIHNQKEALHQHQLLVSVLTDNANLVINNNPAMMKRVIENLIEIHGSKKISNNEIDKGIANLIKTFDQNDQIKTLLSKCNLIDSEQDFIENLMY